MSKIYKIYKIPVNYLQYAKVVKNMMSSPTKLASYRPKTENE